MLNCKTHSLENWAISLGYIEDITWWGEDMNFMFEWDKPYLMSERSE